MLENPWARLKPGADGLVTALRFDAQSHISAYWAKRSDGKLAFLFELPGCANLEVTPPNIKGIALQWIRDRGELALVLMDTSDWEMFAILCRDLAMNCVSREEHALVLTEILARLGRWQRLLMRARPRMLEEHEIRGLFAELKFLELLISHVGSHAVMNWIGPEGAPQDFSVGLSLFEIKAHLSGSSPKVYISSPEQLYVSGAAPLFLVVATLAVVSSADRSLNALVDQLLVRLGDSTSREALEDKLGLTGYVPLLEYGQSCYEVSTFSVYSVRGDFPRLLPNALAKGISDVRYAVSLSACAPFQLPSVQEEIQRSLT